MDTLVDTGFLVALFNDADHHHPSARRMLRRLDPTHSAIERFVNHDNRMPAGSMHRYLARRVK